MGAEHCRQIALIHGYDTTRAPLLEACVDDKNNLEIERIREDSVLNFKLLDILILVLNS